MIEKWINRLVQYRYRVLCIALGFCALMGFLATHLIVDNSLTAWFVDDDPAAINYQDFRDKFGNDEVVVITIQGEDSAISVNRLERLAQVTKSLEANPSLARVRSFANAKVAGPYQSCGCSTAIGPFIKEYLTN
jgi:uncharacterized protein